MIRPCPKEESNKANRWRQSQTPNGFYWPLWMGLVNNNTFAGQTIALAVSAILSNNGDLCGETYLFDKNPLKSLFILWTNRIAMYIQKYVYIIQLATCSGFILFFSNKWDIFGPENTNDLLITLDISTFDLATTPKRCTFSVWTYVGVFPLLIKTLTTKHFWEEECLDS